jgi:predicted DNA binding CopG/RHH family protein
MTDSTEAARVARRARHAAIRAEIADEETEAAEAEAAENAATLDVSLHLRISHALDAELRRRATAEQIPTSALVRRLLDQAVHQRDAYAATEAKIEEIARRVAREELHRG